MEVTTLDKIKKISLRLFNERSYEGTSLKDIFNEIGISAPSFYYYYASKKDLYVELVKNTQEGHRNFMMENLEKSKNKAPKEKLYDFLKAFASYNLENKEEANFIFRGTVFPSYEFREDLEEVTQEWQNFYWNEILKMVKEGKKKGEISSKIDDTVIINTYFNLVMGMVCNIKDYIILKKADDIKPYFDMFYKGISA